VRRWNLVLGLSALFLSGVVIGALGTAIYFKQTIGHVLTEGQPAVKKLVMKKLVRELDLTESQRARIEKVVSEVQLEVREFRRQHQHEIGAILDRGITQMKPELSKDQQEKLDALYEKVKRHRQREGNLKRRPHGRFA
jgi:Spy/CpxP family protein refolding chaperone